MSRSRLTQAQRNLVAEMIGTISDMPKGSEEVEARGWALVSGPLYSALVDLAGPDDSDCDDARTELEEVRQELRQIGASR